MDNEFYFVERFTKMQAWVDLLLLACHKRTMVFIRGIQIVLNPGELCYSQLSLAERWKWNFKTVVKFLEYLKNCGMVETKTNNVSTIISIKNWDLYQGNGEQTETKTETKTETNNNDNNVNNIYTDIFSFWNSKEIIKHKRLDNKTKMKIKSLLKEYSPEEIKNSIENYSLILNNPQHYFFTYKWTLKDFLSRGIDKFLDLEAAKTNYKKNQSNRTPGQINQVKESGNSFEKNGFSHNGSEGSHTHKLLMKNREAE